MSDDEQVYKDQKRFVDVEYGNAKVQKLSVGSAICITGIAMASPSDGGVLQIPSTTPVVIIQGLQDYQYLTLKMPLQPEYGQLLTIVSTVNVLNLTLSDSIFATTQPTSLTASQPVRFLFAGSWFAI